MEKYDLKMAETAQAEYEIDEHCVVLKGSQRFDLSRIQDEAKKIEYLQNIAQAQSSAESSDEVAASEQSTPESWRIWDGWRWALGTTHML